MKTTAQSPSLTRVFVTGATGFVGRQICLRLARDGVEVIAWVRSPDRARAALGQGPELLATSAGDAELDAALRRCDAVIHLAGAGIFDRRWSAERKLELRSSRVETTRRIAHALGRVAKEDLALVSASAVGWYGPRGDERLDEGSQPGQDFLGDLCAAWEQEAFAAQAAGTRVAVLRIGVVLGLGGGALEKMLPPFRMGVGGRLGHGRQWMSWIHAEDLVELFVAAAADPRYRGVINAVAPHPVTNREFTAVLGRALHRPTLFPAPAFALRLALGEASAVLLTGQRVHPRAVLERGFEFRFPTIDLALQQLVGASASVRFEAARDVPLSNYLARRKPRYLLSQTTVVPAPLEEVFEFFSRAENLGAITPASMSFQMRSPKGQPMHDGREIDYLVKVGPIPLKWRSRIEAWKPGERFVDSQLEGPYSCWWHEHRFERGGDGVTVMHDRVWYAPPLGPLGAIAQGLLIAPQLDAIFRYREHAIRLRFGRNASDAALVSPTGNVESSEIDSNEKSSRALARS